MFYLEKFNLFGNVTLIAASYLDPISRDFVMVEDSEKSAADYISHAKDYLRKKLKEII